ncbi:MAG: bifunctional precorrin-2 dehydrogenase/sirohydrochlorin ferrochelatase [Bacteroidia bacterium]|nr:bifunctional precorrin-2 dehydrogenase/sirohydrochlorin ferrochelatase [Bacteroidia bacterium]
MNTTNNNRGNLLFPIFIKPDQVKILIVGGGNIGLEKITFLLKSSPNANVTLVADKILPAIHDLSTNYLNVKLIERKLINEDLLKKDLLIAATNNRALNRQIREKAKKLKILTNVADTPDLCDFYMGSIITKGDLKIAVSTNGKSPTFAKRFRELLEGILPDEIPEILLNLNKIRSKLKGDFNYKVKKLNEITSHLVDVN